VASDSPITCGSDVPENSVKIVVDYKYKIIVGNKANLPKIVTEIESALLAVVVDKILDCNSTHRLARRLFTTVLAISSSPEDVEVSTCGENCSEMAGGITINAAANVSDLSNLKCDAVNSIRAEMGNLSSKIGGLVSAEFVEDPTLVCDNNSGGGIAGATGGNNAVADSGLSGGDIAGIAIGATAFLICLILLLCCRRKGQHNSEFIEGTAGKDGDESVGTHDTREMGSPFFTGAGLFYDSRGQQLITQLKANDVLLDRSSSQTEHEGNTKFRSAVNSWKKEYQNADEKRKSSIARGLGNHVQSSDGRFLTRVEQSEANSCGVPIGIDAWSVADNDTVMGFLHRALRGDDDEMITHLNPYDVLLDPSSSPFEAEGNTRLRAHVNAQKSNYDSASSDEEKSRIALLILDDVRENGGRFLHKVDASEAKRGGFAKGVEAWRCADHESAMLAISRMLAGEDDSKIITQLGTHDVLLDESSSPSEHEGNTRLRGLINMRKSDYFVAHSLQEKEKVAFAIIDVIQSNGGRFLQMADASFAKREGIVIGKGVDAWRLADDQSAVDFVLAALESKDHEMITKLNSFDIHLDKSSGPFEHEGNSRVRALIRPRKKQFASAKRDSVKVAIARKIMDEVESNGGRFLKKSDDSEANLLGTTSSLESWRVADDEAAMLWVMQKLDGSFDEPITQVGVHDVLVDRPTSSLVAKTHKGNGRFRCLVAARQAAFMGATDAAIRDLIAHDVMDRVHANGGRFLNKLATPEATSVGMAKSVDVWNEIDDKMALDYIKQTLASQNDDGKAAMAGLFGLGLGADAIDAASGDSTNNRGGCLDLGCLGRRRNKNGQVNAEQLHAFDLAVISKESDNDSIPELEFATTVDVHKCTSSLCTVCQPGNQVKIIKIKNTSKSKRKPVGKLDSIPERGIDTMEV